jgi:hypothetical protein
VTGEFIGIETITVHSLVIGNADKLAAVFHNETIVGEGVRIRRKGQVIFIQFRDEAVAEIFFPIGRFIEAGFIHDLGGDGGSRN